MYLKTIPYFQKYEIDPNGFEVERSLKGINGERFTKEDFGPVKQMLLAYDSRGVQVVIKKPLDLRLVEIRKVANNVKPRIVEQTKSLALKVAMDPKLASGLNMKQKSLMTFSIKGFRFTKNGEFDAIMPNHFIEITPNPNFRRDNGRFGKDEQLTKYEKYIARKKPGDFGINGRPRKIIVISIEKPS